MKILTLIFFCSSLQAYYDVNIYSIPNTDQSKLEIIYKDRVYNIIVENKDLDKLDTKKLIKSIVNDSK